MEKYPLEDIVQIKVRRLSIAEKALKNAKVKEEQAKSILEEKKKKRDDILSHKVDKLTQLRTALDTGTTSDKILAMKQYLKTVDIQLINKEKDVTDQQVCVDEATKITEAERKKVFALHRNIEKFKIHKIEWKKEQDHIRTLEENNLIDELGSIIHSSKKRQTSLRDSDRREETT